MRRSRMAMIAAVSAVALSASILQAQMFGRRSSSAQDRTADPAPAAAAETSDVSTATPSRGVRQLLRNGLDYLDHYGDPERALSYLREAESRQRELNPTEQRQLTDALTRAGRLLDGHEVGSNEAHGRAVPGAITQAQPLPRQTPGVYAPETSVQRVAAEVSETLPVPNSADPALPADLPPLNATPPPSFEPAEAPLLESAPAPLPAPEVAITADELTTAPEPESAPVGDPIGLTILSDPSDHLDASVPATDEPATPPGMASALPGEALEPPPALPDPGLETPAPPDSATTSIAEAPDNSEPDPSVIQHSTSGVLLIPPPARSPAAVPTPDGLLPESGPSHAPADLPTAGPGSVAGFDETPIPPLPDDPAASPMPTVPSAEPSLPSAIPIPEAIPTEAPLPIPDDVPAIDLSQVSSGSADPAAAADPTPRPVARAESPSGPRPRAVAQPTTPPAPFDVEPAAATPPTPEAEPLPPLPVEATAIPPRGLSATADAGTGSLMDAVPLNDDSPSTSTLRPETLREVEEIARRQDEESRRNPRVYQPGVSLFGENPDDLSGGSRINLPRAPSPTEARPLKPIPVPEEFERLGPRVFAPNRKYWAAAATPHMPLYFQDAVLERYGQSVEQSFGPLGRHFSYPLDDPRQSTQRMQLLQPLYSTGLFVAQIVALPYNVIMDPPWEAQYDLGYFRPGDPVPPDLYYLPATGLGPALHGNQYGRPRGPRVK